MHCSLRIAHAGKVLGNQQMVAITCIDACEELFSNSIVATDETLTVSESAMGSV